MHQKVILVDHLVAAIGTVNLDNRSLRINFEATALVYDQTFIQEVEHMLLQDFADSFLVDFKQDELHHSYLFRLITRVARLFAPVL